MVAHKQRIEIKGLFYALKPVNACGFPCHACFKGEFLFRIELLLIMFDKCRKKLFSVIKDEFFGNSFRGGNKVFGKGEKISIQAFWKIAGIQAFLHLVNHGIAHEGNRTFPCGSDEFFFIFGIEAFSVRSKGQIIHVIEPFGFQAWNIVEIPCENMQERRSEPFIGIENEMRIIDKPRNERQFQIC